MADLSYAYHQRAAVLFQAIAQLKECCSLFSASVTAAISTLQAFHDSTLQRLKSEKEQLTSAMEAVAQETANSVLAQVMRSLTDHTHAFGYHLTPPDLAELCSSWLRWENRFELLWKHTSLTAKPPKSLCFINKATVKVFSLGSCTWVLTNLSEPLTVDSSTRYVWLERNLFCSGGRGYSGHDFCGKKAYVLEPQWTIRPLPDMKTSRYNHGLWWDAVHQKVLTFGGKH